MEGGLGKLWLRGPADKPVGNLRAEARAGALIAPFSPRAQPAAPAVAPKPDAERGRGCLERGGARPGAEGLQGRADNPADPQQATGSRACRTPRAAGAPAPGLSLRSPPQSRPPRSTEHLLSGQCPAGQARVPGANGRACPARVLGSVHPARAAGLGVQGRAKSECASALQSPRRNPRLFASVLGIDGSISAF